MVKPEWGTKRTCPKCGTRFYDLGTDDPVQCIECGNAWQPEPVLKSKQPLPFEEAPKKVADNVEADADLVGERSEEHTSELQSLMRISYAVFCLKKKKKYTKHEHLEESTLTQLLQFNNQIILISTSQEFILV